MTEQDGQRDANMALGRFLVDLGAALIQGRLQWVGEPIVAPAGLLRALGRAVAHPASSGAPPQALMPPPTVPGEPVADGGRYIPPPIHGRPNRRGARLTPRKGYAVKGNLKARKVDTSGLTPAGTRLMEYLARNGGAPVMQIASDLGLSKKTVENVLSLLKQRQLIDATDLEK